MHAKHRPVEASRSESAWFTSKCTVFLRSPIRITPTYVHVYRIMKTGGKVDTFLTSKSEGVNNSEWAEVHRQTAAVNKA
jgi:hypothetical protein